MTSSSGVNVPVVGLVAGLYLALLAPLPIQIGRRLVATYWITFLYHR
jgi:hypothetical protein